MNKGLLPMASCRTEQQAGVRCVLLQVLVIGGVALWALPCAKR